ncbi:MAG: argininosuccinate lyase [Phascolarctobacterium sp.]|nr:argininosuccinate lyase [Phascolarctobacterium sp.]
MRKLAYTIGKTLSVAAFAAALTLTGMTEAAKRDNFFWLGQINKATAVINTEEKLLTQEQGHRFAQGIATVLEQGERPDGARPNLVITFEPLLIKAAGPEITKLHAGRSSQDMLTTVSLAMQREQLLELAQELNTMQRSLVALAEKNQDTILPNYTNGVAAQPNSLAHYLLAYNAAFSRDMERLQAYYGRINRSPMGACVLNGTGWPLNRDKMAQLLGFDSIAYNTYDAGQVFPQEAPLEMGGISSSIAIHIGGFIEEIMQQYAQPRPWILLKEGNGNTYVSSAMPQKRNPGILNRARTDCSTLLGIAVEGTFRAHNIPAGMADGRLRGTDKLTKQTISVVKQFNRILNALEVKPERALEELNLDWTCSQEIADVLMRKYEVPFRTGHHFASEIVTYARQNNVTPATLTYEEASRIYARLAAEDSTVPQRLPLTAAEFRSCLDPVAIVHNRAVKGGPQPVELQLMLGEAKKCLGKQESWQAKAKSKVDKAEAELNKRFQELL